MVEGPGCKVKGEVLKARVRGQRVKRIDGSAVSKLKSKPKKRKAAADEAGEGNVAAEPGCPFNVMLEKSIQDVQTLGKELFIFFEGSKQCLRMHFLMAGGFRVNGKTLDHEGSNDKKAPVLILELTRDTVTFTLSSALMRSAEECRVKMKRLRSLDICDSKFSYQRAVDVIMSCQGRQVCDVLLDQEVLPGVGNIIKNEALFDSGIHPDTKAEVLTEKNVSHLVKMTRDFSMLFYKCRKEGHNLGKYLKIYRKGQCKQCSAKTVTTRMGDDSPRLTSFCSNCQTNDPQKLKNNRTLPSANSLLSWVTNVDSTSSVEEDWSCSVCTLVNRGQRKKCEACLTPRQGADGNVREMGNTRCQQPLSEEQRLPIPLSSSGRYQNSTSSPLHGRTLQKNRHAGMSQSNSPSGQRIVPDGVPSSNALHKPADLPSLPTLPTDTSDLSRTFDLSFDFDLEGDEEGNGKIEDMPPTAKKQKMCASQETGLKMLPSSKARPLQVMSNCAGNLRNNSLNVTIMPSKVGQVSHTNLKPQSGLSRMSQASGKLPQYQNMNSQPTPSQISVKQPLSQALKLFDVPKCGQHKLKCLMREVRKESSNKGRMFFACPAKQCNIFQWADESFPLCEGHGKRCAIRTVLKQGANNGRRFFACSQRKTKQCQFFQWADEYNDITIR